MPLCVPCVSAVCARCVCSQEEAAARAKADAEVSAANKKIAEERAGRQAAEAKLGSLASAKDRALEEERGARAASEARMAAALALAEARADKAAREAQDRAEEAAAATRRAEVGTVTGRRGPGRWGWVAEAVVCVNVCVCVGGGGLREEAVKEQLPSPTGRGGGARNAATGPRGMGTAGMGGLFPDCFARCAAIMTMRDIGWPSVFYG
jgi:hypothetical protein